MAYTTINKHTEHFNTKLFTGNGSTTQAITGVGFQPDLFWIKCRNEVADNQLSDVLRGKSGSLYYQLQSNGSGQQVIQGDNDGVHSLDSDGFTVGHTNSVAWNKSGNTYATWNWKAGGSGSANTAGTINSTVSVNQTAGFSIVKYTGNGVSGATVGHGLNVAPKIVLIKKTSASDNWSMLNTNINLNYYLKLNGNDAQVNDALFNNTAPSTTVFTVDSDGQVNGNGNEFIAYCWTDVPGFSKMGYYIGNGSSSNPAFIYTGFKPKWVMVKVVNDTDHWFVHDSKRDGYNDDNEYLFASLSNVEGTNTNRIRLLSNGFSVPTTDKSHNQNGNEYVFMAFGQSLVGSNNVPCTAR